MRALLVLVLVAPAVALSACGPEEGPIVEVPTTADALIAFARAPSFETWDALPLAATVQLGLAADLVVERSPLELRDPGNWRLAASPFRGRSDTYSALELIATEDGKLTQGSGEHPHCAAPPVPPPPSLESLERIWVQPADADGCLDWWTVDAFVNEAGEIEAVTLDLWEP